MLAQGLHRRMQPLLVFFIDAVNYLQDEATGAVDPRWEVYLAVRRQGGHAIVVRRRGSKDPVWPPFFRRCHAHRECFVGFIRRYALIQQNHAGHCSSTLRHTVAGGKRSAESRWRTARLQAAPVERLCR